MIIEDNVWIGEGVVIMPNVRIGRNAIVGANAVVTKDVPADCVVGGIPARVIRFLTAEQDERSLYNYSEKLPPAGTRGRFDYKQY